MTPEAAPAVLPRYRIEVTDTAAIATANAPDGSWFEIDESEWWIRAKDAEAQRSSLIVKLRALRDDMQTIVTGPCAEQNPSLAQRIDGWATQLDALLTGSPEKTDG